MSKRCRPLALIILDGWGHSETTEFNALAQARTPTWDRLWADCPHTLLHASSGQVGLPEGQMGNSEVGHMNLGSGRVVHQDYTLIGHDIETGEFFSNPVLLKAVRDSAETHKALHVFGLLSPGGVHSHEEHLIAFCEMAARNGVEKLYLHAFLDGRDTPPKSAGDSIARMEETFSRLGRGRFASLCGRFYAMDRDDRWQRVQQAYEAIAEGRAEFRASSAAEALLAAYGREETDEFVKPTLVVPSGQPAVRVESGDHIVFMNFRADRAKEITRAFLDPDFKGFPRQYVPQLGSYVTLTEYDKQFKVPVAYPPEDLSNVFGEYISKLGLRQLRIAETEKYAHVTFFFDGGLDIIYPGEERILVPSPKIPTYDLKPEMSAQEVTDRLVEAILRQDQAFDAIICNYANTDMVGHTGNFAAAIKAVEFIDACLARVLEALRTVGGEALVTADHGNIEKMSDPESGQVHTAHTTNLVPFVYVGPRSLSMNRIGALSDVAPTLLEMMGYPQPREMTGTSLVTLAGADALESAA